MDGSDAAMTDLFDRVEGPHTDAALSLVGGTRQLEGAVLALAVTRELEAESRRDRRIVSGILKRVAVLAKRAIDPGDANPADAALTVYLFALSRLAPDEAVTAARLAAGARNCWWASRVAEAVMSQLPAPAAYHRCQVVRTGVAFVADQGGGEAYVREVKRQGSGDAARHWTAAPGSTRTRRAPTGAMWTIRTGSSVSRVAAA